MANKVKTTTVASPSSLEETLNDLIASMKLSKKAFKNVELDIENTNAIRSMVSLYYMIQDSRIRASNQKFALDTNNKSSTIMDFFKNQMSQSENNIATYLDVWTDRHIIGKWAKSNNGIGPVIAAGMVSRFDITKVQSAGGFWKYAGMAGDSDSVRQKGEKITYSPETKVLVWKAASSFKMQSTRQNCYYGKLYLEKKTEYIKKNDSGGFADRANNILATKNFKTNTQTYDAYASGKLSLAHIDAMAMRYAGKIFVSHLFDVMWMCTYGEMPPAPYATTHIDGHPHILYPRNLEIILPYLNENFPGKDFKQMMINHYKIDVFQ